MPAPHLKRRSYGFSDSEPERTQRTHGTTSPPPRPPKKKKPVMTSREPRPEQPQNPVIRMIKGLFVFVFRIIGWIFGFLWGAWKRRPHLSSGSKQRMRANMGKIILFLIIFGFIGTTATVIWASKDLPDPNRLTDRPIDQSTKIYDRTGQHLLFEVFAEEKRTLVQLEDIPDWLIKGVIATEDTEFYSHHGIRPLSILRAVAVGLLPGKRIAGTSTLTQQLVKNAILTDERRISRKIKEAILSIRLEQKFTKDQILQIYFNEIPYGSTNYGVESASQSYFGKSVKDLTLAESATLAGMPKAPSTYLNNHERLKERRDFVLRRMFEEGYITEEEKDAAQAEPLNLSQEFGDIKAPHFVLYVKEQLVEMFDEKTVDTGGLKVITSLDWDKQQIAEKVFDEKGTEVLEAAGADNLSLVSMDPRTGEILTMMGSKDFYDEEIDGQFNVATLGLRQPGSSFKPIVYTAAFEKGYTPETVLFDVVTDFGSASGQSYKPLNYNLKELGPVTMRQALQGSLNIPAVKALYLVGEKKGVEFAERLGYSSLGEGDFGLSLVLGGGEVKLLDHVTAYSVFANGGTKYAPVSILSVEDSKGDFLYEWEKPKGEKVLDAAVAATISNVLSDDAARAYAFGAGSVLTLPGRPVAAKTGTTNNYVDGWTIGYTPSLVTGVWGGNTDNSPMKRGFGGSAVAGPVWNAFMKEALAGTTAEAFPNPPPNDTDKAVLNGSEGGAITLKVNKVTGNLASSSTPENLIVERTYTQAHSILHYVDKDNPRGPVPENPQQDPQYTVWENAIQDWITRKKEENPDWEISFEDPPIDIDDEYALELIPSLEVIYPAPSSTIFSRQIDTDIRVTAPRGVTQVTYKIDDKYVGVINSHPFNLNYFAEDLTPGLHTLTIIVEDDIGNRLEETSTFTLEANEVPPSVAWNTASFSGQVTSALPRTLFLRHIKLDQIAAVEIVGIREGEVAFTKTITDFSNLFNNQIPFTWQSAEPGSWKIEAQAITKEGVATTVDSITATLK